MLICSHSWIDVMLNFFRNFIENLIPGLIAQAQVVVAQLQGHVSNLSQQATALAAGLLQQLQEVAAFAHGQALSTIQGLIANLRDLCKRRDFRILYLVCIMVAIADWLYFSVRKQ
jgi:hypothetical protein